MKPILRSKALSRLWAAVGLLAPALSIFVAMVVVKIASLRFVEQYLEWIANLPTLIFFLAIVIAPIVALWLSVSVFKYHRSGKLFRWSSRLIAISAIVLVLETVLVLLSVFYLS